MNKKYVIIGIIIFIVVFLGCISIYLFWPPKFTFNNEKTITLKYGQKYQASQYKISRFGKEYTKKAKITNNINYKKIGTYYITYTVKINGITFKKQRKIKIVDKEKPKITLNGSENTIICPNTEYKEEGYTVTDNYDKNLNNKVKITTKENKIIYTVKDSSSNKTSITRTITKEDKTPPTITLKGNNTENIYIKSQYQEAGYTAIDNCDNDITNKVSITGSINNNQAGSYKLTYTVKDNAGNETSIQRTINIINQSANKPGTIYLTFDDGPSQGTTNVILDILKSEGIKATFFVTGKGPDSLIKREYDEGHTVALHTYTHNYSLVYSSPANYYNDLYQIQNRVKNITGFESKIIRFPGGSSNTISRHYSAGIMSYLTKDVQNKGFHYFDWNVSSGDAGATTSPTGVYSNVIKYLSKNHSNVVLMHDIKPYTRDALKNVIEYGKNNGYTFERITMDTSMVTQRVNN
jgi:peptidoglycan/xylan/chitin deacetylase (PgdA/CDA1 family)